MRHLTVLFIHFISTLARLLGPGGVRSLVAESLLLKHTRRIIGFGVHAGTVDGASLCRPRDRRFLRPLTHFTAEWQEMTLLY
jgi:hypothetical protein